MNFWTLRRPQNRSRSLSQTWKSFLLNPAKELIAVDFFAVPMAMFRVLYVFLVVAQERRKVLYFNLTDYPSATWTAQQLVEDFPYSTPPRHLLHDRDRIDGAEFVQRTTARGCEQNPITAGCAWQNPFAEQLIGSIR